jgi:hypothetical protein
VARSNAGALAWATVSVAFLLIALIPSVRGGSVNATFLAVGVVFLVLSIAAGRRRPPTPPPGPGG